jgi:hypothetical protein
VADSPSQSAEQTLRRLARVKRKDSPPFDALGAEMVAFFKQSVEKRNAKFSKIANRWTQLVPETLAGHCALESYSRGTLVVLVDSASHLYELKQLLLAGLQQQLLLVCANAGLRKINLRAGRWYDQAEGDSGGVRKPRF